MIEMMLIAFEAARAESELKSKLDRQWHDQFMAADPAMKKIMLDQREKQRKEEIEERRHREQIRAQERIADAIRSSSFWRF